jgi:hypothetical protein
LLPVAIISAIPVGRNGENGENEKKSHKIESFICFSTCVYDYENNRIIIFRAIFVEIWLSVHREFPIS